MNDRNLPGLGAPALPRRRASKDLGCLGWTLIIAFVLVLCAGVLAFQAWILMLLLGAIASATGWPIAVGFWVCVAINMVCNMLLGSRRVSND